MVVYSLCRVYSGQDICKLLKIDMKLDDYVCNDIRILTRKMLLVLFQFTSNMMHLVFSFGKESVYARDC